MTSIKNIVQFMRHADADYIATKQQYYTRMYLLCVAYIFSSCTLYTDWFDTFSLLPFIYILLVTSVLSQRFKQIVLSQFLLFVSALLYIGTGLDQVNLYHFYGNIMLFIFISVIVYIEPWQIMLTYISFVYFLIMRSNNIESTIENNLSYTPLANDNIFINFTILSMLALAIFLDKLIRREVSEKRQLSRSSERDVLTGLYNRSKLDKDIITIYDIESGYEMALIDIDLFKEVNDTYGHDTGDAVLMDIARTIQLLLPEPAYRLYRWGGEEFLIISPVVSSIAFDQAMDRIRETIQAANLISGNSVTVSIGCVRASGSYDQSFVQVDRAMYKAKDGGRNRLVRYQH